MTDRALSFGSMCLAVLTGFSLNPAALAAPLTDPVRKAVEAIQAGSDNQAGAFIVLDKVAARLWVFDPQARLIDSSPVLIGAAVGDDSVQGIGERPMAAIQPHERTTPAGRFRMEPGRNLNGEDIFWVDYDAAVSLHRLRGGNPLERRPERMASPTPYDNRISYGCINLPPLFFDRVIHPQFSDGRGWIYVLPETRAVESLFMNGATTQGGS